MKKEFKCKVGDIVWVSLPMNARVIKVTQKGYILETDSMEIIAWSYFTDEEIEKLK